MTGAMLVNNGTHRYAFFFNRYQSLEGKNEDIIIYANVNVK